MPQPNKSFYGVIICHLWTKLFQKQCIRLGFAINLLEIKLTKTKKSIQNNEITVSLIRKTKREYYSNLDVKNITNNKTFWKTVKPFLSDMLASVQKNNPNRSFFSNIVVILGSLITIIAIHWQGKFRNPF